MGKYIPVEPEKWGEMVKAMAEVTRLKAEVERLKMEESKLLTLCETYEGDLERLRKAGDAMLPFFIYPPYEKGSHKAVLNWNAAKEGKQP